MLLQRHSVDDVETTEQAVKRLQTQMHLHRLVCLRHAYNNSFDNSLTHSLVQEEIDAATLLQATFRGHLVRKSMSATSDTAAAAGM